MKNRYLLYILIFLTGVTACNSGNDNDQQKVSDKLVDSSEVSNESPVITFVSLENDLGELSGGEIVQTYFKYENTGDAPLYISSIKAGCGCTVPHWNEEPLSPGESENIKVIFNSSGKHGNQNIRVIVKSNARNSLINLAIKAVVSDTQ